jgi:outer membrane protein assembly factor BamB
LSYYTGVFRAATIWHSQSSVNVRLRRRRPVSAVALLLCAWLPAMTAALGAQAPPAPPGTVPDPAGATAARKGAKDLPEPLVTFPGGVVWQTALAAPPTQPPAFDGTRAYVALRDETLVGLLLDTGTVQWTVPEMTSVAPTADGGTVYGARESDVWARDGADGRLRWEQTVDAPVATRIVSGPGVLVLGTITGEVVCLNTDTGTVRWRQPQSARSTVAPAVIGARVFVGLTDGQVVALDLATGKPLWTQALAGGVTALTAADTRLLVGSEDNYLYVLETRDGARKWKWRTGGDLIGETVQDAKRLYYVSLDNTLRAHNRRNGQLAWQRNLTSRPSAGPVWIGDRVVVGGIAPELRAFSVLDGQPGGVVGVPGRVIHRPYLTESVGDVPARLVVVTGGGQVQAIGQTLEPPLLPLDALPGARLVPEVIKAKAVIPT